MWRLREKHGNEAVISLKQVKEAIYEEIGLDERTVKKYIKLLKETGQIKRLNYHRFRDKGAL